MTALPELGARALLDGYRARSFSPVDVLDELAARIEELAWLGGFTTTCLDRARLEAQAAEAAYARGEAGALAGVPFGVKDLFDSADVRTTYGSPMFAEHVPAADAEAVRRARAAGAILVGKTQTHEFAWGITSANFLMGHARNPWAPERIAGGSSGGSAVVLATGQVPLALGSDTGGSIRVPSAFCGTVGLKPTWGRISAAGAWPLARSLDHPGPMARSPQDAALFLSVLAGADAADPATEDVPLSAAAEDGLAGVRVGVCPDLHLVALAPDVQHAFEAALAAARDAGAELVEVGFPDAERIYPTFVTTQRAEALHTHQGAGLYPTRADEYGADVRARLDAACAVTLDEYLAAAAERQRVRAAFRRLFERVDVLLTPVSAGSPVPIGEDGTVHLGEEIDFRELVMSYTVPQDLTGLPTCAVRAGFDELGIPVGVQLTGPAWAEARVLAAAGALHAATPGVQGRRPELLTLGEPA